MSFLRRLAPAICRGLVFLSTVVITGTATAVSWTYLDGPFGGQPLALFVDAAGNTWAGMNGSGIFYRAAGTSLWVARPGLPTQSNYRFAIDGAGTVYVAGSGGVYALGVGATTWQGVSGSNGLPGQAGGGLATDAAGAVYAGMNDTGAVYKLAAGATTWIAVGTGLPPQSQVNNLVFDGAGNLWASIYGAGVFKLAAGSATWSAMNASLDNLNVQALEVAGNDLFAGNQFHGAYKLANASGGGSVWTAWNGGSLHPGDAIYGFARGAGNTLYAAGYGIVYALSSGASTWTAVGTGLNVYGPTYSIAYSNIDGALTIGNIGGALVLPAGALAWQLADNGMTAGTVNGLVVAGNGDLYAATFGQGVQRQTSGSSTWSAVDPANTAAVINAIVMDGPGTIYASSNGDVVKLGGGTWSAAGTGQGGFAYSLAIDAANGVWVGEFGDVRRLPLGGPGWAVMGSGLPAKSVVALALDGAGTAYAGMYGTGVYALAAGGGAWTVANAGLTNLNVLVLTRDSTGAVLVGTGDGVFKLVAGTWQRVGTGLTDSVYALAFDTNGDLYAGVDNGYAWRLAAGSTVWAQVKIGLTSRTATAFAVGNGRVYAGTDASRGSPSGVFVFVPLDTVVEFYNDVLDHFFITATFAEQIAVLNGAAGPGWSATGDFFNTGGPLLVCRFYGSLSPGPNSHFYTIDPAECQQLKDLQATTPITEKRWNFESNDFASSIPVGGACASGMVPVYRAYNNGFARGVDSNHRITANHAAYLAQVAKGWIGEGVVMCAPDK